MEKILGFISALFSALLLVRSGDVIANVGTSEGKLLISDDGFVLGSVDDLGVTKFIKNEIGLVGYTAKDDEVAIEKQSSLPFGIRNNNAGNIRATNDKWRGAVGVNNGFVVFDAPEYGLRALAKLLNNYYYKHDLRTVAQIIGRWAPTNENNTSAYVNHVSKKLGVSPTQELIFPNELPVLMIAIILHENGVQPYSGTLIMQGVKMAVA